MPTYDFECTKCKHVFEDVQTLADAAAKKKLKCPKCGKSAKRLFTPTTMMHCNLEGGQNVKKKVNQITLEIIRRQKSAGFGPAVDLAKMVNHGQVKPPTPKVEEKSAKYYAREMKKIAHRKKAEGSK